MNLYQTILRDFYNKEYQSCLVTASNRDIIQIEYQNDGKKRVRYINLYHILKTVFLRYVLLKSENEQLRLQVNKLTQEKAKLEEIISCYHNEMYFHRESPITTIPSKINFAEV